MGPVFCSRSSVVFFCPWLKPGKPKLLHKQKTQDIAPHLKDCCKRSFVEVTEHLVQLLHSLFCRNLRHAF